MPSSDPLVFVRYLDVVLVVLAAPFVLLMGGSVLGYTVAALTWIVTRIGGAALDRWAERSPSPRVEVGVVFSVLLGRAWCMGIAILAVGLAGERRDGLMAGLVALVAFSVYFATQLVVRPMERNTPST